MSQIFRPMKIEDIGSGVVNRRTTINGKERVRGDELTHADLASIAVLNRNAMIENRVIDVFPKHVPSRASFGAEPTAAAVEGEFHVVAVGFGKYKVIKGIILLADSTKEAAAEFVATQQAKAGEAPQEAALRPPGAPAKRQRRKPSRAGPRTRTRRPAGKRLPKPPEPGQENGPV